METWKGKEKVKKMLEESIAKDEANAKETDNDKEKFKQEVAKRTTARKKAEKKEIEVAKDATENGQAEETREFEEE